MQNHDEPGPIGQDHQNSYQAFLLRCWAEPQGEGAIWRFSLEAISNQARHGFADLPALLKFLEHEIYKEK